MEHDAELDRAGFQERAVTRHRGARQGGAADSAADSRGASARIGHSAERTTDRVAEEMPVALVFNGISHAVMMVTPRELEAFALGFALTEGLVGARSDVYDIELHQHERSYEVDVTIAQENFMQLKQQRRSMAGRSGCGVCGIESLELLDLKPQRIEPPEPGALPALQDGAVLAAAVTRASRELGPHQILMKETGGVHAAAWCEPDGAIVRVCEDVGRHNALDKLIGHLADDGVDMRRGFVFMSSRASYELVRKAARMNMPMLATISAPSTLAIEIAEQAGLKLVSFCRQDGCVEYT